MDMSVDQEGSFAGRPFSGPGYTAVAHVFVMEWAAIVRDLIIGLLIAGAMAACVPVVLRFLRTGGPHVLTQMQRSGSSPERS